MARSPHQRKASPTRSAWITLAWFFGLMAALAGLIAGGTVWSDATWTPKLALDLQGGTEIILEAVPQEGQTVTQDQLNQAVNIIRQRIDASGVGESEISTQGERNIVIGIPGEPDQATLDRIRQSAKLDFRSVLYIGVPGTAYDGAVAADDAIPADNSSADWITQSVVDEYDAVTECTDQLAEAAGSAPSDEPLVVCDDTGSLYILSPVDVSGERISGATSGMATTNTGASTGQWVVDLTFDEEGTTQFAEVSQRIVNQTGVLNQFAIVLDGEVISAPTMNAVIENGKAQISGSFTQETATSLANQLKFGALPVSFETQSNNNVSATLGSSQLSAGLIAGLIGILLIIVYSIFQYRALAVVTIASLGTAAVLTYLVLLYLSWRNGYRLSLAGVTGIMVSFGMAADSFIVYFERVRDELRDGKPLAVAVQNGWRRAVRTLSASKAVSFLAAVILFILSVGSVRGFAFTIGVTAIVDLVGVIMFTHPMLVLISRTKFFSSGNKWSGLDPNALGAVYRGRAQFRTAADLPQSKRAASSGEAARRQTIAERKAAQATTEDRKDA